MDYKNPKVIVRRFNVAVEELRLAIRAKELGDREKEIKHKQNISSSVYQAFEWSLKHHLNKRFSANGNFKWRKLTQGKHWSEVSVPILIDLMYKYANPKLYDKAVNINADIILKYRPLSRNKPEHEGYEPDLEGLIAVFPEVQKTILTYVDDRVDLSEFVLSQSPKISNWEEFLSTCGQFDTDNTFYALVVGPMQEIDKKHLHLFGQLPWSLVIDFDRNSKENGFYFACFESANEYPHDITLYEMERQKFSRYSKKTYWCFANGLQGRSGTFFHRAKDWKSAYEDKLGTMIGNFARQFSAPIKIVICWDQDRYVEKIVEKIYKAFGNKAAFIFTVPPGQGIERIVEDYEGRNVVITVPEISTGILNYDILVEEGISEANEVFLPHINNSFISLTPEDFELVEEDFEVVHKNIEKFGDQEESPVDFYRGERISWYGLKKHFDVDRKKTRKIIREIEKQLSAGNNSVLSLVHSPGIGGTTISRRIAWELHEEFPTLILKNYVPNYTFDKLRKVFDLTKKTLFVVIEVHLIGLENIKVLHKEISSETRPVVFLVVLRGNGINDSNEILIRQLDKDEKKEFLNIYTQQLAQYEDYSIVQRKKQELLDLNADNNPATLNPFYMGLVVFEKNFKGIKSFIEQFVKKLVTEEQRKIVIYLAISYKYEGISLPANFFVKVLNQSPKGKLKLSEKDVIQLDNFLPDEFESILVSEKANRVTYWRPRHYLFADELLIQLLGGNSDAETIWIHNLPHYLVSFIKDSVTTGEQSEYIFKLMQDLFIRRNNREIRDNQFSEVISEVNSVSKERIFNTLVECYPNEPHFWGHLARYYSIINRNTEKAIKNADEAIRTAFLRDDCNEDPLLYHIKGTCIREDVYDKIRDLIKRKNEDTKACISQEEFKSLKEKVEYAGQQFEAARDHKNDEHGYVAHIQMLIRVLDMGYIYSGKSRAEFLKENINTWYGECLDLAEELLEYVKRLQQDDGENEFVDVCEQNIRKQYDDYGAILDKWNSMLETSSNKPRIRREIVRAYHRQFNKFEQMDHRILTTVTDLMEQNIIEEPQKEKNIYLWFQAARYNSYLSLDLALEKLALWKAHSKALDAKYYFYILKVFKAIEGYSVEAQEAKQLIRECTKQSANLPYRTHCFEWYGKGANLGRLVSDKLFRYEDVEKANQLLEPVKGIVSHYEHPGAGTIEIDGGLSVFFKPSMAGLTEDHVNKEVVFNIGFSYDGLRAYNNAVRLADAPAEPIIVKKKTKKDKKNNKPMQAQEDAAIREESSCADMKIGSTVECEIIAIKPHHVYVSIPGVNERASIWIGELSNKFIKNIYDEVVEGQKLWAKVISYDNKYGWGLSVKKV